MSAPIIVIGRSYFQHCEKSVLPAQVSPFCFCSGKKKGGSKPCFRRMLLVSFFINEFDCSAVFSK